MRGYLSFLPGQFSGFGKHAHWPYHSHSEIPRDSLKENVMLLVRYLTKRPYSHNTGEEQLFGDHRGIYREGVGSLS